MTYSKKCNSMCINKRQHVEKQSVLFQIIYQIKFKIGFKKGGQHAGGKWSIHSKGKTTPQKQLIPKPGT